MHIFSHTKDDPWQGLWKHLQVVLIFTYFPDMFHNGSMWGLRTHTWGTFSLDAEANGLKFYPEISSIMLPEESS